MSRRFDLLLPKPPAPERYFGLDLLRALAITLVVFRHYPTPGVPPKWFVLLSHWGWTGVDLFFLLSGYLITHQILRSMRNEIRFSVIGFYLRRSFRILPAYWVVVALYFLISAVRESRGISPLWAFLTFTQNFIVDIRHPNSFTHAWSLCVEEHFYLLLPPIVLIFTRPPFRRAVPYFLGAVLGTEIALRYVLWLQWLRPLATGGATYHDYQIVFLNKLYYPTFTHLDGFVLGAGLSLLHIFRPQWFQWATDRGAILFWIGLVALAGIAFLCRDFHSATTAIFGFFLFPLGYSAWLLYAIGDRHRLRIPGAETLARLSYAIYLTHKFVIHWVHSLSQQLGLDPFKLTCTLATCLGVVGVGGALHWIIESPFLRLRERLILQFRSSGG